ncbi:bifunctional tRNA (5-methylaminomethyl-2-thiouridine)(34)-methyltransferase MnmD/FAD-dependent 5-carboxymethylaminomethyl-2-thiouridine(34) oxidoreductase MnmC [Salinispirillum sp. LH 10-3-1]|uniref:tRNA 5-methylaminomethyl-2-thiouridine biosynthesis bifunctional protein MnmC n=1 Tax=Salinispirillum sp. LH 10-3-1 TaxID=2952525 RepID=A0AB38YCI3_9GAMM
MQFADLEMRNGVPFSPRFDDIYFSRQGGTDETRHVFLGNNNLPERFPTELGQWFTIGETGFGTGLNFITTLHIWRETPRASRLHFISVEKYPVSPTTLRALLLPLREELPEVDEFLAQYHSLVPGWNRLSFSDAELSLFVGDALSGLNDIDGVVDAWYLDGFTPAKNGDLWNPTIYHAMARLSRPGTTVATFTAALPVREGLNAAGFLAGKCPGFGLKRTMCRGHFIGLHGPERPITNKQWWSRPIHALKPGQTVGVLGSGLAAAETAQRLRHRGYAVTLIAPDEPGSAASGNDQGAVYAKPGLEADPATCFYAHALSYRVRLWQSQGQFWPGKACGLVQVTSEKRWQRLAEAVNHPFAQLMQPISQAEASALSGVTLSGPALFFPQGGWLSPSQYCKDQLALIPRIATRADQLTFDATHQQWVVNANGTEIHRCDALVIAAGQHSNQFPQTEHLRLKPVRGQVSQAATPKGSPRTVVCGDSYLTPADDQGHWHFGASFDVGSDHNAVKSEDTLLNRSALAALAPEAAQAIENHTTVERAAVRATTPDYLPMSGPVLIEEALNSSPTNWYRHNNTSPLFLPGLYVLTGLGSKGLASSALCAEQLVCLMTGEPTPMGNMLGSRIHPGRFWRRT